MHELSIANSLVEIASEHAQQAGAAQVKWIQLRIGALSCVHQDALRFSFDLVTRGTLLQDAQLKFVPVPVVVYCEPCGREVELPGIQKFRCPACDTPSGDIRQGQELEVDCIEIIEKSPAQVK